MKQVIEWLAMGGYYSYVWSAYALVFLVLTINVLLIKRQRIGIEAKLQRWLITYDSMERQANKLQTDKHLLSQVGITQQQSCER